MTDALMSRSELAVYLGVPEATLAAWAYKSSGPPFFHVGRHARYRRTDVDAWLEGQRVGKSVR
jgi:excisionase family DNA binding protein